MKARVSLLLAMICLLAVLTPPTARSATTITVQVKNFAFDPDTVTVQKGDTVRWQWISGAHTVTAGESPSDPQAGFLFDESMSSSSQVFEFTFDTVGDYPYFCRPHFAAGMMGFVKVQDGTPVDPFTWGKIKTMFETTSPRR